MPQQTGQSTSAEQVAAPCNARKNQSKASQLKMQINGYITNVAEAGDIKALLATIQAYLGDMNDINLATAMHRVGKLSTRKEAKNVDSVTTDPAFEQLYKIVSSRILNHPWRACNGGSKSKNQSGMQVQNMSVIAWACSIMKIRDEQLFAAISEVAAPRISDFQPFEMSQLIWAFAKLSLPCPELFGAVSQRLLWRQPGEFKGLCLSMIAWSFATAEVRDVALFQSLASELPRWAEELRPQELSSCLKAFAQVGVCDPALFDSFGLSAAWPAKIQGFKMDELVDLLWAFAQAGRRNDTLFAQVGAVVVQKRWLLTLENIVTLFWVYAELQVADCQPVLFSLLEAILGKMPSVTAGELSKVLSAYACLGLCSAELMNHLAHHCGHKLLASAVLALPSKDILVIAKAWQRANMTPPVIFDIIIGELTRRCPSLDASALMATLQCALNASLNPWLAPRTGFGWIGAASQALAPLVGTLGAAQLDELHHMLAHFQGSQAFAATSVLQQVLADLAGKASKFDSTRTDATTFSVTALSEFSDASSANEDAVWDSIRQQSAAKGGTPFSENSWKSIRGHMLANVKESRPQSSPPCPPPAWNAQTVREAAVEQEAPPAKAWRSLTAVLSSESVSWADAARIAQGVLKEADEAHGRHGPQALQAVRFSNIFLDSARVPALLLPEMQEATGDGHQDPWPVLSYQFGLVLRSICEQIGRDKAVPSLLQDIIASCLRASASANAVPQRGVVEASLTVLVMQADMAAAVASSVRLAALGMQVREKDPAFGADTAPSEPQCRPCSQPILGAADF
eukprot:CAMPEP_0203868176 /NCGR_PEP_ID=MMETSP0359-20131031/16954_1 /ASSEMBLY_ACC=CAM_ASM_000338 /TAXON_ID=268821 /ORGANISM="Scrippsiella Hangoei, Strain SHTV-5" /LENGTH=799 /DNA_ID=CAMNT_0050786547 /DNA_START=80 /DNA_END=2478 /DNA_ORIENTATION=+